MTTNRKNLGSLHSGDIYAKSRSSEINSNGKKVTVIRYYVIVDVKDQQLKGGYGLLNLFVGGKDVPHVGFYELLQVDGEFEYLEKDYQALKYIPIEALFYDMLDNAQFYGQLDTSLTYDNFVDFVMRAERRTIVLWSITNVIMMIAYLALVLLR